MENLTKTEYKLLNRFYELDMVMTKKEFSEHSPEFNANTVALGISNLYKRGFLEVAEIRQNYSSLSRAYRPKISIFDFYRYILGEKKIELFIKNKIHESKSLCQLEQLLLNVQKQKKKLLEGTRGAS